MKPLPFLIWTACLLGSGCTSNSPTVRLPTQLPQGAQLPSTRLVVDSLRLVDAARNRVVPIATYSPTANPSGARLRLKVALLNHGYGGYNTDYTFVAQTLADHGYFVASIQHELRGDEPLAMTGKLIETRKPNWERGVQNMQFVLTELRHRHPELDYRHLLLMGHSNGGDMVMLFAEKYPQSVDRIISFDNRRMPLPRAEHPQVLSLRSSDQLPDSSVLPSPAEQAKFRMQIVQLARTLHNDMWDGATPEQKQEMTTWISRFLEK